MIIRNIMLLLTCAIVGTLPLQAMEVGETPADPLESYAQLTINALNVTLDNYNKAIVAATNITQQDSAISRLRNRLSEIYTHRALQLQPHLSKLSEMYLVQLNETINNVIKNLGFVSQNPKHSDRYLVHSIQLWKNIQKDIEAALQERHLEA